MSDVMQDERRQLTLESVLANIVRGRVVRLELSREQKRALRDPGGQIALDVLRHLLGAREAMGAVSRFPVTENAFLAVAHKLGYGVPQKRARALPRRRPATTARSTTTPRSAMASTSTCSGWWSP